MKYVSRVPQPPLDQLVDDLDYLEGTPPYSRLKLPPMPSAVLILNLGDRFLIGNSGTLGGERRGRVDLERRTGGVFDAQHARLHRVS